MAGARDSKALRSNPEDVTAFRTEEERKDMWTSLPGRVKSFDPTKQTATVEVMYKPRHNGEPVDMPDLLEVPVMLPRAGGFVVTSPVKEGDGVMLQFASRDISNWHGKGEKAEAATQRMHDLSDAVAILGMEPSTKALSNYNSENFEIRSEDGQTKIEITPDGKFKFASSSGEDILSILRDFMLTMQSHTNLGAPHDQAGEVAAQIARLDKLRL